MLKTVATISRRSLKLEPFAVVIDRAHLVVDVDPCVVRIVNQPAEWSVGVNCEHNWSWVPSRGRHSISSVPDGGDERNPVPIRATILVGRSGLHSGPT